MFWSGNFNLYGNRNQKIATINTKKIVWSECVSAKGLFSIITTKKYYKFDQQQNHKFNKQNRKIDKKCE